MGAIREVFGKEPSAVTISDIENLIHQKREEGHILEYKGPDILSSPENLSKWVSAFLNSDGGLIVVGLVEDNPKKKEHIAARIYPTGIEFVGGDYPKERVEQLVMGNIGSLVKPDIGIYPIRAPGDQAHAVYLVEVPQGDNPPYQAADKKYYRRLNATKYAMSHSEIADFFGRRRKPRLAANVKIIEVNTGESWLDLRVSITNAGKAIARYACVTVSFQNLEIIKVIKGPPKRIDELRGDVPCLQWDNVAGVVHPGLQLVRLWDIRLTFKETNKDALVIVQAVAEDQELTQTRHPLHWESLSKKPGA